MAEGLGMPFFVGCGLGAALVLGLRRYFGAYGMG